MMTRIFRRVIGLVQVVGFVLLALVLFMPLLAPDSSYAELDLRDEAALFISFFWLASLVVGGAMLFAGHRAASRVNVVGLAAYAAAMLLQYGDWPAPPSSGEWNLVNAPVFFIFYLVPFAQLIGLTLGSRASSQAAF